MGLMDALQQTVIVLPPLPGEGPIVYENHADDLMIIARLGFGEAIASVWSWREGDVNWTRNYIC
jgi:hypothetical protein